MVMFHVLYVRRSDGKLTTSSKKQKEKNEPTAEQLDQTPNAQGVSDYYRPITEDEPKYLDWRKKLGGMLARELCRDDLQPTADKAYILHALPENYRLYEHIKSKSGEAGETKSKNHAGGGHDRQDAYLYGHPSGRRKRFRSPVEFFPHLLWLATDPESDSANCSCKICTPDELQPETPREVKQTTPAVKREDSLPKASPVVKHRVVEPPRRPVVQNDTKQPTPTATPTVTPATIATPLPTTSSGAAPQTTPTVTPTTTPATVPVPVPTPTPTPGAVAAPPRTSTPQDKPAQVTPNIPTATPLPPPRSTDQQLDMLYNKLLYRVGELVWFNKGQAWGLGIVGRRWYSADSTQRETRGYLIQPLSHPFHYPTQLHIDDEKNLRPWLAWSAPIYTCERLNGISITYDTADWDGIRQKRYGLGDAEVDASILAARAIDSRYTLCELTKRAKHSPNAEVRHWNSIFLGGEKIWVGEPIRTSVGGGMAIMILIVIEETVQQLPGQAPTSKTSFIGDMYQFVNVPYQPQVQTPTDKHLPLRIREDLRYRNSVTMPTKRVIGHWKLAVAMARIDVTEVKGRWYESSLLMPLLNEFFHEHTQRGEVEDCGIWMNSRGDASPGQPIGANRRDDRHKAFGRAVPSEFRLIDGIQPPSQAEITAATGVLPPHHDQIMPDHAGLEQFMDLDAMEHDGMPAFGHDYGSQEPFHF